MKFHVVLSRVQITSNAELKSKTNSEWGGGGFEMLPIYRVVDKKAIQIPIFYVEDARNGNIVMSHVMYVYLELKDDGIFMCYGVYTVFNASSPIPTRTKYIYGPEDTLHRMFILVPFEFLNKYFRMSFRRYRLLCRCCSTFRCALGVCVVA